MSSTRGRRNSAYGTKAISQKQDPRPVTNKAYIMEEIELVIEYLTSKHYDRPLSVKVLQSPTQRDFVSIFMFLYHQVGGFVHACMPREQRSRDNLIRTNHA